MKKYFEKNLVEQMPKNVKPKQIWDGLKFSILKVQFGVKTN